MYPPMVSPIQMFYMTFGTQTLTHTPFIFERKYKKLKITIIIVMDADKIELNNAIEYFKNIVSSNISTKSEHKVGVTFIGIRTNISGKTKLHIYMLLFPFMTQNEVTPYPNKVQNLYLEDIHLSVDYSFYLWMYAEMQKQNSIVIMSYEDNIFKVVNGTCDLLVNINNSCNEQKEWMELGFEEWYKTHHFNNIFTITITNPHLYMVPFPVKPITVKTQRRLYNYCDFYIS
jgi:hypothetical protein